MIKAITIVSGKAESHITKIKLCGLTRPCDIHAANLLRPDYVGFVFALKSRRYISPETAAGLKKLLRPEILSVGVFVNESQDTVLRLLEQGVIDIAQLHGSETTEYIRQLKARSPKPVIQAFSINGKRDIEAARHSSADYILLDSGTGGTGTAFDWQLLKNINRPYFLAGGLTAANVGNAVRQLHPYAVDTSSGIETDGHKDPEKMAAFVSAVRTAAQSDKIRHCEA